MSDRPAQDPAYLRRYLLGELCEEDMTALEERYFDDPELVDLLEAVSDELCDDYVRGQLPAGSRLRIEALARSGQGGERLRFSETLVREVDAGRPPRSPPAPGRARLAARIGGLFRTSGQRRPAMQAAGVFGLVILAVGWPYAFVARDQWRAQAAADQASAARETAALRRLLAIERERSATLSQTIDAQSTVQFSLFDQARRGAMADSVIVPAGASAVRIELGTEVVVRPPYGIEIRRTDGALAWRQSFRDSADVGMASPPAVRVPASVLEAGRYEIRLLDVRRAGRGAVVAQFALRVLRR